jgi:hypothetical protein
VFRFKKRLDCFIISGNTKDVIFDIVLDYVAIPSLVLKKLFTFPLEEVLCSTPRAYSLALLNLPANSPACFWK